MGDIPMHLEYVEGSMFDKIKETADRYPAYVAFDLMGRSTTYRKMVGRLKSVPRQKPSSNSLRMLLQPRKPGRNC